MMSSKKRPQKSQISNFLFFAKICLGMSQFIFLTGGQIIFDNFVCATPCGLMGRSQQKFRTEISAIWSKFEYLKFWSESSIRQFESAHGPRASKFLQSGRILKISNCEENQKFWIRKPKTSIELNFRPDRRNFDAREPWARSYCRILDSDQIAEIWPKFRSEISARIAPLVHKEIPPNS